MSKSNLKTHELGQLQIELLKLLWKRGSATVQDLLDAWPHSKPPAYVTILTVLRRLEKRGFLAHDMQGRAFVYRPLVAEHEVKGDLLDDLVKRLFGSPSNVVSGLLNDQGLTLSEVSQIRKLVEQKEYELKQRHAN
jgi:BlaI family transcriptional regulator, penicillinase repressor